MPVAELAPPADHAALPGAFGSERTLDDPEPINLDELG